MTTAEKRIWDLPVRITHWGLVISFFGAFFTAELNPMIIHYWFAFIALTLAIFRVIWGFIGSENARFLNFVRGYEPAKAYLQDLLKFRHKEYWGHNPLGALMVISAISLMILTVVAGLFARNRDLTGPWADSVSPTVEKLLNEGHSFLASVLMTIVVAHIAAILFYRFVLHDNLIKPMVTGMREPQEPHPTPKFAPLWLAGFGLAIAIAISGALFRFWLL